MTAQDNSGAIPAWAVPGAKCVCLNGKGWEGRLFGFLWYVKTSGPAKGDICTIDRTYVDADGPSATFLEIASREGYVLSEFRPITTRSLEHDIGQFTHLLSGSPVDA